jgi:hypothetical protein
MADRALCIVFNLADIEFLFLCRGCGLSLRLSAKLGCILELRDICRLRFVNFFSGGVRVVRLLLAVLADLSNQEGFLVQT